MEIVRENAKISQMVLDESIECNVETNVIVPDKNPDILKILQVDTTASIGKKQVKDGRLTVSGKVYADVIYLADSEEGGVKSLPIVIDFTDFFDSAILSQGMHISLECDVENAELDLINSRKIALRATVGISAEVIADAETEYIKEIIDDDVEYRCDEISGFLVACDDNIEFLIKEESEIAEGASPILDIIKCDSRITDKEVRASGTKTIVKGAVSACVLYTNEEGNTEFTNVRFPFTEVFETGGGTDESMPDVSVNIIEKSCKVSGDRCIRYEFLVRIEVSLKQEVSYNFVSDCYFYGAGTKIGSDEVHFEKINKLTPVVKSVREIISSDVHMPRIASVYNVLAKPRIISTEKSEDGISVNARLDVSVLYLSDSKENPVCVKSAEIPVVHKIDTPNMSEISLMCDCEHISYVLTSGGGVEIRASVVICGEERKGITKSIITTVEKGEKETENEIVIVFASGGENLWDIAKKYKVSREYLKELNGILDDNIIEKGKKLIIPV